MSDKKSDAKEKQKDLIRPLSTLGGQKPPAPDWFEKAIATPSEEGAVEVGGARIRYSVWGEDDGEKAGRGLLFVHGGRAHRNWWRPFAPFFSENRRVAALDLSGMGDSDWRETYSLDRYVDEVFAVIDKAGLAAQGRPVIVGHSFGGWVTLAAVEREGEKLGGAVVVDSPLGVPDPREGYTVIKAKPDEAGEKRSAHVYPSKEEMIERFRLLPNQPAEHLYLIDYIAREGLRPAQPSECGAQDGEGWTWKFDPGDWHGFEIHFERDLLRAARCPLAFIYGEKSMFAGGDGISHLREQARGRSPFVMMPEAHHHLMMDQPLAFVSALRTLLSAWPVRFGAQASRRQLGPSWLRRLAQVIEFRQKTGKSRYGVTMTDEAIQRTQDAEEHKKSYEAIMGAATEIGVPFSMALAMFFTGLVTRSGVLMAILMAVVVYILAHVVVKMFFSHHEQGRFLRPGGLMKLAVLKETRSGETRVAATPETVKKFISLGASVAVQAGAGEAARFADGDYQSAGASISPSAADAAQGADIILKVLAPSSEELRVFGRGSKLIAILSAYKDPDSVAAYARLGVDAMAMELMPRITRAQSMDVLSSQSNLAGYKAVIDAAAYYGRALPMMMTAAGTIAPAKVFVMGAGVAGLQAIATARRLGAVVSATDVRFAAKEQVNSLGATFVTVDEEAMKEAETEGGYAKEMSQDFQNRQAEFVAEHIAKQDIVITTALIPGRPAPQLVSADMVRSMKPGSVIVDLAVEAGGNVELSRAGEAIETGGVTILGFNNVPGRLAADASSLYARNIYNFIAAFFDKDTKSLTADPEDAIIKAITLTRGGAVVHEAFAAKEDAEPVLEAEAEPDDAPEDTTDAEDED